jgi:hypothetical protein
MFGQIKHFLRKHLISEIRLRNFAAMHYVNVFSVILISLISNNITSLEFYGPTRKRKRLRD